jgi:2-polyprenyl-3-methyl-5-hydroxy-6-metoxy-1,4-benzoquinol methylase
MPQNDCDPEQILCEIGQLYNKDICDYRGTVISKKHVTDYFLESCHRTKEIVKDVSQIGAGKKILDIGMGYGFYDIILKESLGFDVTGLEIQENVPVYCRLAQAHGIQIIPGMLSKEPLPIQDCSFDFVIFSEVLEHLRISPFGVLSEIRRILRPKGLLLLTTPNVGRLTNILKLFAGKNLTPMFPDDDTELAHITDRIAHIREYTMGELTTLMTRVGYKILKASHSLSCDRPRPNSGRMRQLARWMLLPLTGLVPNLRSSIVILGEKKE